MTLLAQPLFLQFVVPLITVAFTIFLKVVSRNDRFKRFKKEDLAVGLDLAVTALIIFVIESANLAHQLSTQTPQLVAQTSNKLTAAPWIILAFVVGIWAVSSLVRWFGWKGVDNLKIVWGIVAPDLFGLFSLIFVINWIR